MEFDFDKEIDTFLRKARGIEDSSSTTPHLDADEISAFAENALPDAARMRLTMHFADCARCRNILSNTFAAHTEVTAAAAATSVSEPSLPWYRRFFVFPQLAYTMGALVLLFSGFLGYVLIRNVGGGGEVATAPMDKMVEKPVSQATTAPPAANAPAANISVAPTPAPITNNTNAVSAERSPAVTTAATPSADGNLPAGESRKEEPKTPVKQPEVLAKDDQVPSPAITQNSTAGGESQPRDRAVQKPSKSETRDSVSDREEDSKLGVTRNAPSVPKKKTAGDVRNLGGKTFNNVGGIWFDSAYNKQPTTTVKRNTDEYRRLDSGLRSLADQLGGTVVILWKNKGYRIE